MFHAFDVTPALAASVGSRDSAGVPPTVPIREIAAALQAQHTDAVYRLTDAHGIPRDCVHVREGRTRGLIVALTAQLHADAVVMGAVSRRGLKRLFLGNTAEEVLDELPCDLLIVKPARFETTVPR